MTLEQDIRDMKEKLEKVDERSRLIASRTSSIKDNLPGFGLYAMVFLTLVQSCDNPSKRDIQEIISTELDRRPAIQQVIKPELRVQNVFGSDDAEIFYEIDGTKAYINVDGKPVEPQRNYVELP